MAAWLAALALFLIWLGWVLFSTSPIEGKAEKPSLPGVTQSDLGTVLDTLPAKGSLATPNMPFTASQEYVLTGAGLQGFYQTSAPNDVWTLSYPEPQLNAQVIKRGPPVPEIVTQGVDVTWELGRKQVGERFHRTRQGRMNVVEDSFFAASIPVSAVNADGVLNPYPVITLRAKDEKTGKLLAESAAVLAVSPGFGCAQCHANAGTAILEVHDRHQSTHFMEQHAKGEVIACRSCHVGLKGGKAGEGKSEPELSVSAAIHGWHATYLADRGADACKTCHVDLGRTGMIRRMPRAVCSPVIFMWIGGFPACAATGSWRIIPWRCSRPSKRLGCRRPPSSCPASRHARSLWTRSRGGCLGYRNRTAPVATISSEKPNLLTASAFNKWTPRSEGLSGLFSRRRDDMLIVRCIVCHGAPHAVYPARNPLADNLDNLPPLQYQQQAATLGSYGNCALCHGSHGLFGAPSLGAVERKGNPCAFRSAADHAPGPVLPSGAYAADQLHHLPSHGIRGRQVPPVHEFRMP